MFGAGCTTSVTSDRDASVYVRRDEGFGYRARLAFVRSVPANTPTKFDLGEASTVVLVSNDDYIASGAFEWGRKPKSITVTQWAPINAETRKAIEGTVSEGMSRELVRLAWGPPYHTSGSQFTGQADWETWTYQRADFKNPYEYLHFRDGRVVGFSY